MFRNVIFLKCGFVAKHCMCLFFFFKKFDLNTQKNPLKNYGNMVLKLVSKYSKQRVSFGWIHFVKILKIQHILRSLLEQQPTCHTEMRRPIYRHPAELVRGSNNGQHRLEAQPVIHFSPWILGSSRGIFSQTRQSGKPSVGMN